MTHFWSTREDMLLRLHGVERSCRSATSALEQNSNLLLY